MTREEAAENFGRAFANLVVEFGVDSVEVIADGIADWMDILDVNTPKAFSAYSKGYRSVISEEE